MFKLAYRRILLKLSGEALMGDEDYGIDPKVIGRLAREVIEAQQAYELVSSYAIGSAISSIREQRAAREGRPSLGEYRRVLELRDPQELTYVRELTAAWAVGTVVPFEEQILPLLAGIAARRGERWSRIQRLLGATRA